MPRPLRAALWPVGVTVVGTLAVLAAQLQAHPAAWIVIAVSAVAGAFVPTLLDRMQRRAEIARKQPTEALPPPPSQLLAAGSEVVDFIGRQRELAALRDWLATAADPVRLIWGAGGVGKTRLALKFERQAQADGWTTKHPSDLNLDGLLTSYRDQHTGRLLVIIDYAETRVSLSKLITDVAAHQDGKNAKVLLLARSAGEWWNEAVRSCDGGVRSLLEGPEVVTELEHKVDETTTPQEIIQRAAERFAQQLGKTRPPEIAVLGIPAPRILDLHAAALIGVLNAELLGQKMTVDLRTVMEELLSHERSYWTRSQPTYQISPTTRQTDELMAVACLLGTDTESHARDAFGRAHQELTTSRHLAWYQDLYLSDDRWAGSVQPDRLAEHLVISVLTGKPELQQRSLDNVDAEQARHALTVLGRASTDSEAAQTFLERLMPQVVEVIETLTAPPEVLNSILNAIPYPSVKFAGAYAAVIARLLQQADSDVERARLLDHHSLALAQLGRRGEALTAINEAVRIRRHLATTQPDTFNPDLALALNNQSLWLANLGHREEALTAINKAVNLYRNLTTTQPDTFNPDLALALNNQSLWLANLGHREEALTAINKAVNLYRDLTTIRPYTFNADLALTLNNQSLWLANLGHREEALTAINKAVNLYREATTTPPDTFNPDLARALNNQSVQLANLGHREEALTAINKAVNLYRNLATTQPDTFNPDLALALNNQSLWLANLGHREEALTAINKAVNLYRNLTTTQPDTFNPDLALALNNQSVQLANLGHREEALTAINKAVRIRRHLAAIRPDTFNPDLANSLGALGVQLREVDDHDGAVAADREAIVLYLPLARRWPSVFTEPLQRAIKNTTIDLRALGRTDGEIEHFFADLYREHETPPEPPEG
ncbi:MAG: hypothetical protein QM708_01820 [Propioniciclava sp.]|uniref:tetratricopeptide repeat protein n=1 Tax=Propioniciclava sp. TaxID=2038686 RepID=UPI0039E6FF94